jgi:hypothetical protein
LVFRAACASHHPWTGRYRRTCQRHVMGGVVRAGPAEHERTFFACCGRCRKDGAGALREDFSARESRYGCNGRTYVSAPAIPPGERNDKSLVIITLDSGPPLATGSCHQLPRPQRAYAGRENRELPCRLASAPASILNRMNRCAGIPRRFNLERSCFRKEQNRQACDDGGYSRQFALAALPSPHAQKANGPLYS